MKPRGSLLTFEGKKRRTKGKEGMVRYLLGLGGRKRGLKGNVTRRLSESDSTPVRILSGVYVDGARKLSVVSFAMLRQQYH